MTPTLEATTDELPRGKFLSVVGIDGSGKSTLLRRVAQTHRSIRLLHWQEFEAVTRIQEQLGAPAATAPEVLHLLGPHSRAGLLSYIASLEYELVIEPTVAAGSSVIVDSYWYKFVAKMLVAGAAAPTLLPACQALPPPDGVFFLEIDPERAYLRKEHVNFFEANGPREEFPAFQRGVQAEMLRLLSNVPVTVVDATLPVDTVYRLFEEFAGIDV